MPNVLIPTPLRAYVDNNDSITVSSSGSVNDLFTQLCSDFPKLKQHLYNESGELRKFVNIYIGDTDIRDLDGVNTPVNENQDVSIIPSIAGG